MLLYKIFEQLLINSSFVFRHKIKAVFTCFNQTMSVPFFISLTLDFIVKKYIQTSIYMIVNKPKHCESAEEQWFNASHCVLKGRDK